MHFGSGLDAERHKYTKYNVGFDEDSNKQQPTEHSTISYKQSFSYLCLAILSLATTSCFHTATCHFTQMRDKSYFNLAK